MIVPVSKLTGEIHLIYKNRVIVRYKHKIRRPGKVAGPTEFKTWI